MEFQLNEGIEKHVFLSILDAIDSGITVIDCNGVTIFYNKAASKIEGLDPEEVIGKHLLSIYPSLNENNSSLLTVLKTKWPVLEQQQTLVTRTGKRATVVYSTYPLFKDGVLIGAFDISRDITEIKNLSERLVDLQAKLMDSKKGSMASSSMASSHNSDYASIYTLDDIIGENPSIVKLKKLAQRVAYSPSPILIYGETGTGKEVLVQAIHNEGATSSKPFVAQNCAALPATLLESILMGTVKGSFTGSEDRPGLLEIAHEGTLLLDEINSMPLDLQSKILRVLQEGSFRRIGDTKLRFARPRIVACTNVDPAEAVKNKQLRIDLYYRLNVISLHISPLRERKEDIPLLVRHFISKLNDKFQVNVKDVDDRVMSAFHCYDWPGNVRELQHCLEHAVNVMSGSVIKLDHLPFYFTRHFNKKNLVETTVPHISNFKSLPEALNSIEGTLIREALMETNWNATQAARMLKIPRQTLQYKMRNLELNKNKGGSL